MSPMLAHEGERERYILVVGGIMLHKVCAASCLSLSLLLLLFLARPPRDRRRRHSPRVGRDGV